LEVFTWKAVCDKIFLERMIFVINRVIYRVSAAKRWWWEGLICFMDCKSFETVTFTNI